MLFSVLLALLLLSAALSLDPKSVEGSSIVLPMVVVSVTVVESVTVMITVPPPTSAAERWTMQLDGESAGSNCTSGAGGAGGVQQSHIAGHKPLGSSKSAMSNGGAGGDGRDGGLGGGDGGDGGDGG